MVSFTLQTHLESNNCSCHELLIIAWLARVDKGYNWELKRIRLTSTSVFVVSCINMTETHHHCKSLAMIFVDF